MTDSQARWIQAMIHLKSYFDQHEANPENSVRWAKVHDEVCLWLSDFGTTGKILDAGCRRGEVRRSSLFPASLQYFGIDPLKVDGFEYPFDFRCETLESTSFENETFDFVLVKDSVDCFAEPLVAFASAFRILKRGGRLLITEDDHSPDRVIKSKAEASYPNGDLSTTEISNGCIKAGFRDVNMEIRGCRLFLAATRPKRRWGLFV